MHRPKGLRVEFFSLPLSGRQTEPSSEFAGKVCFDKRTHTSLGKPGRQTPLLPLIPLPSTQEVKPFQKPQNGKGASACLYSSPKVHNFHSVVPRSKLTSPHKCKRWQGCLSIGWPAGDWQGTRSLAGLARLLSVGLWFPGQLNPVPLLSQRPAR